MTMCSLVLIQYTNVTDGRTDGRTTHHGIGHNIQASRGKNSNFNVLMFHDSLRRLLLSSITTVSTISFFFAKIAFPSPESVYYYRNTIKT